MLASWALLVSRAPGRMRKGLQTFRREKEVVLRGRGRLRPEEVREVAHGEMTKESRHLGRLAVGEIHLGRLLAALLEGREAIQEAPEEDPEANLEAQDNPPVLWATVAAKTE